MTQRHSIFNKIALSTALLVAAVLTACGGGDTAAPGAGAATTAQGNSLAQPAASANAPDATALAAGFDLMTEGIIVKLRANAANAPYNQLAAEYAAAFSRDAGVQLSAVRENFSGAHVLRLPAAYTQAQALAVTERLAQRADVEYAEPDTRVYTQLLPNDNRFAEQWSLREAVVAKGGANVLDAWDLTQGDPNLVMAVIDSGVLPHSDFGGRLIAGFDFISDAFVANDGNGRDANATDPGDWLTASEARNLGQSSASNSSFHGTHVAGILGAAGNNAFGTAGINWKSKILPVRAIGKGGGRTSDIADGIVWAAGIGVPGVPNNPTPARVINLSLGGSGACPRTTQDAINAAAARGAVVVVAAGNENVNASQSNPANCQGVITVAAVGRDGQRASYSNFGSAITLAAPGGGDGQSILSLGDSGRQSPIGDNIYVGKQGTSMATPVVAGVVSLMLSVNPALTAAQVKSILVSTARPFPVGTGRDCSTTQCGAGIVNAGSAVKAAASGINTGGIGAVAAPQSGWWWNPNEPGRGFAIEIKSGKLFFGGFLYDTAGNATWSVSGPANMRSPTDYTGSLDVYAGGQSLNSSFTSATLQGSQGQLTLKFTGPGNGILTWPGGSMPIQRFEFAPGGLTSVKTNFAPENGWWLDLDEPGRGYAIEVQGNNIFVAGFMYDASGRPVWHLSQGAMTNTGEYNGTWVQYGGGQSLSGPFRLASVVNPNLGGLRLQFSSTAKGNLTLPNGRVIPIEKFDIGFRSPFSPVDSNKLKTSQLLGSWVFSYTLIDRFFDYFLFDSVAESTTTPGKYYVYGVNQYDQFALGSWYGDSQSYAVLVKNDVSFGYDDFYFMSDIVNNAATGCYFFIPQSTGKLGTCYPLYAERLAQGSSSPLALTKDSRDAVLAVRKKAIAQQAAALSTGASLRGLAASNGAANGDASGAANDARSAPSSAAIRHFETLRREQALRQPAQAR